MNEDTTLGSFLCPKDLWRWVRINSVEQGVSTSAYMRGLIEADKAKLVSEAVAPPAKKPKPPPAEASPLRVEPGWSWSKEACDDWAATLGNPQGGRIGIALKPLVAKLGWGTVRPVWQRYLAQREPKFASPSEFASKFSVWQSGVPAGPSALSPVGKPPGHVDHNPTEEQRAILGKVNRKEPLTEAEGAWFSTYMNG